MLYFALVHVVLFSISYTYRSKRKERVTSNTASEKHNLFVHSSNIGQTKMSMKSSFFNKSRGIQESRARSSACCAFCTGKKSLTK